MQTTLPMQLPALALDARMPEEEFERFMRGLRELDDMCGCNKNDSVIALTCACIDAGINTGSHIIATLRQLGYNVRHIGMMLHHNTGNNSERYLWTRSETGAYCNTNA